MTPEPLVEAKPGAIEDLGIEIASIVDDDRNGCARPENPADVRHHGDDPVAVGGDRSLARPSSGGAHLELTAIATPDNRDQTITVSVNGVPVGEATTQAELRQSVDFAVPQAALDAAPGLFDIRIDYPTATEMTPHDSDTHYRSIKLRSVQVRRPGDPPSTGAYDPGQHGYAG